MHLGDFEKGLETSKEVNVTNHLEAEVYNCVVRGQVPKGLDGTFYRYLPDFPWSRIDHDDVFINGNGCIDAVRFQNGHVDFKQRYVRMAKFVIERAARQAVLGKYGNRYMEDPRVKHMIHSTAHSNIVYYQNQLLATKMDSLPYVVDPDTMETKGVYDYNGQYKAPTHTARPKIDPRNGELITMGYETKGDSSPDIAYYLFDRNAKKLEECWVKGPYASMILDVAATDKWIVFVLNPLAAVPVEMMHTVHHHFACDPQKPAVFGVLPRRGPKPEDVKWFHFENTFIGHTGNAFDGEEGCIYMDTSVKYEKLFWSSSPEQRSNLPLMPPDPSKHKKGSYVRWRLDPNANDLFVKPIELIDLEGDTPKIDERFQMQPYKSLFFNTHVGAHKEGPKGASWNAIARCDVETGKYDIWNAGPDTALHGVAFSPRGSDVPEGDGYLISIANRCDTQLTSIVILDSARVSAGPIAVIQLPFSLDLGICGSWVSAADFAERKVLSDVHRVNEIHSEFENKPVMLQEGIGAVQMEPPAMSAATTPSVGVIESGTTDFETWPSTSVGSSDYPAISDRGPSIIRTGRTDQTAIDRNKQLVRNFYRRVFDGQNAGAVKDFVTEDYIQHGAHVRPGRAGLEDFVRTTCPGGPVLEPAEMRNPPTFMVAEGDMVVVSANFPQPDPERPGETYDYYVFDSFRIERGKLAEHWSSINKIAPPIAPDFVPVSIRKRNTISECKNIAIVGAGIGGLAVAVRLQREGFDVDVYEQASELREVGAAIGLRPRTAKILASWGLKDRYTPLTSRVGNILSLDGSTGTPIGEIVIPSETDDPDENWSDIIHRGELHSLLSSEIPRESIHLSHKCIRVTDLGNHVELTFSDGRTATAAAVVGADGIHSRIRPLIMQTDAVFSGLQGHRGILPFEKVKDLLPEKLPCNWLLMNQDGVLSLFVVLPYGGGQYVAFDAVLPANEEVAESWRNTTTRDELIERLSGFEPRVQEIVRRFDQDEVLALGMYDRDPISQWTKNRITLLGDAAHPMLPTEGQGANMAIQDAQTLGDCLSGATHDQFPAALQDYAELRIPITREIQRKSRDRRPFDFEIPPHLTM